MRDPSATPPKAPAIVPGGILIGSALLAVFALAHHPVVQSAHGTDAFREIAAFATMDRAVHAAMIAIVALLLFALSVFAQRRDVRRPWNLFALIAYAIGTAAFIGAATLDGFVIPDIAGVFGAPADVTNGIALLKLCAIAIQILTKLGLVAMAAAVLSWSAELAGGTRAQRVTAVIGVAAVAVQAFLVLGSPAITANAITLVVGAQACWYVTTGFLLIRGDV